MRNFIVSFWYDQSGATGIESAALALFLGLTILGVLQFISPDVKDLYALIGLPAPAPSH